MKKVAVLGCGYWGKNLVRNFHALGALACVADPAPDAEARAAELAPGVSFDADVSAVLARRDIDGVVIAAPAALHAQLCQQAIRAGKDVLCEKPLALRYEDAKAVADLARQRERVLMVGHILEYHPAILKLRSLIDDGALDEIRYIYTNSLNLGKVRREENILWSFAPHDLAVILRLMGRLPFQLAASADEYHQPNIADATLIQRV